jgi:predicted nucleotidyltransferase
MRIRQLLDAMRSYRPERVYLFGSWARGEADDLSDLDVVVIKRTSARFFDRLREVLDLLPPGPSGIDVLVYTPEEFEAMRANGNAFAEMIVEEGKLIYGGQAEE